MYRITLIEQIDSAPKMIGYGLHREGGEIKKVEIYADPAICQAVHNYFLRQKFASSRNVRPVALPRKSNEFFRKVIEKFEELKIKYNDVKRIKEKPLKVIRDLLAPLPEVKLEPTITITQE